MHIINTQHACADSTRSQNEDGTGGGVRHSSYDIGMSLSRREVGFTLNSSVEFGASSLLLCKFPTALPLARTKVERWCGCVGCCCWVFLFGNQGPLFVWSVVCLHKFSCAAPASPPLTVVCCFKHHQPRLDASHDGFEGDASMVGGSASASPGGLEGDHVPSAGVGDDGPIGSSPGVDNGCGLEGGGELLA